MYVNMADEVKKILEAKLEGAEAHIRDFTGGGDHLEANVVWSGFAGMSRLKQHRAVNDALQGLVGPGCPIHALTIKTWAERPDELASPSDAYFGSSGAGPATGQEEQ